MILINKLRVKTARLLHRLANYILDPNEQDICECCWCVMNAGEGMLTPDDCLLCIPCAESLRDLEEII